jgi:serine/threonine protein kinase/WD40 repeat protein/tetratricopeptide (TPR) repeat protein
MSYSFHREYLVRLPLPLAQLYRRAHNAKDARGRHDNAFYLFEALIKLAAAPAVAAYLREVQHGAQRIKAIDRLLAHLALPSLGQWVAILRELARHFSARPNATEHPLGHLWDQLNRVHRDRPDLLALYRRIKNGPDGEPAGDLGCSLLQLLEALVQYRNGVFGHGAGRFDSFYERQMGPLLIPAADEVLSEGMLDPLGPRGSRLVYLTEIRAGADGRFEVGLIELVGTQGIRLAPVFVEPAGVAELAPERVAVLWPGRANPMMLDPLLIYRDGEVTDEVLFLNRDRDGRQVEYLSYLTGRTLRDPSTAPALAALLNRITGQAVDQEQMRALAEQSVAETPSVEVAFGPPPSVSRRLGDFELLAEIGQGGMGVVYLARQLSLGRLVALKMLPGDLANNESSLARFQREIRVLSRLDHPNIVKVLASGVLADGRAYYAMEYVPGCDLEQVWRELAGHSGDAVTSSLSSSAWAQAVLSASRKQREQTRSRRPEEASPSPPAPAATRAVSEGEQALPLPPLPEQLTAPDDPGGYARCVAMLMRDAALALQAVHDQKVVHRDIKPSNLMLTPDGARIVLMDFGLAKGQSQPLTDSRRGGLLGTLRYAAPEQLAAGNLEVGPPADVRGLGGTLWELLTRRRLFEAARDEKQLAVLVHDHDVPPIRSIDPGLDRDLDAIVIRATERRVSDRIATAGRLADYLQLYLDGKPLPIRPRTAAENAVRWLRRHRTLVASGTAALVVIAATILVAGNLISRSRALTAKRVQMGRINQQFDAELDRGDWSAPHLARIEGLLTELGRLSAQESETAGKRLDRRFADSIRESMRTSGLEPEEVTLIRAGINRLGRRDTAQAKDLEKALASSLGEWQTVFDLRPPFGKVDTVFGAAASEIERPGGGGSLARRSPVAPGGDSALPAKIACAEGVQLEAEFSGPPSPGSSLGVLLNYTPGHSGAIFKMVESPDGKMLASAGPDLTVLLWDVDKATVTHVLRGHTGAIYALAFTPDGRWLASHDDRGEAKIWDVAAGKERTTLHGLANFASALGFSDDGRILTAMAVDRDGPMVKRWDVGSGREVTSVRPPKNKVVSGAIAPGGKRVAAGCLDSTIRIWDAESGAEQGVLRGHLDWPQILAFSPNGNTLASTARDRTTRLWSVETWKQIALLPEPSAGAVGLAFRSDGRALALGGYETVLVWDLAAGQALSRIPIAPGWVTNVAFAGDGRVLAGVQANDPKAIRLWDVASVQERATLRSHSYALEVLAPAAPALVNPAASAKPEPVPSGKPEPAQTRSFTLRISRNGETLREAPIAAIAGPLRVVGRREGDRVHVQINELPQIEFQDIFPLGGSDAGVFGVTWGGAGRLERLHALRRTKPTAPSRLARGDQFYQSGRYAEALAYYEAQSRASSDPQATQEVRCKQALCLIRLKRDAEAASLLEPLTTEVGDRWPAVATCQFLLLRLRQGNMAEADALVATLTSKYRFEEIAGFIPAVDREQLCQALIPEASFDPVGMVRADPERIRRLEKAIAVGDFLHGSASIRFRARSRLVDALHVSGQLDRAIRALVALYEEFPFSVEMNAPFEHHITKLVWMLLDAGQPERALQMVNNYFNNGVADSGIDTVTYSLYLYRARVYTVLRRFDDAEKDIDELFRRFPQGAASLDDTLFAYLVRGIILERRGDASAAQAIWREGFAKARERRELGLQSASILGSWTGELSEEDVQKMVDQVLSTLVGNFPAAALFKNRLFPLSELTPALREMWRSPRGREYGQRVALFQISYADFHRGQVLLSIAEGIHQGTSPGELPAAGEELIWKTVNDLYAAYASGKLQNKDIVMLLLAWNGTTGTFGWSGVSPSLEPPRRAAAAFFLGQRYLHLDRPADAATFFSTAREDAPLNSEIRREAQAALDKMKPAQKP